MASIINTNIAATRTHNVYNRNNDYMNAAMTRVATGMKINSAKDGASTWAISEKMRERMRANDQANQNIQNDTAMLKTAQGGISNTIDILTSLKERAINAMNDSNLNVDRGAIATEVLQLGYQMDDNAAKVKFNGRTLLNGDVDSTKGVVSGATVAESTAKTVSSKVATMDSSAPEYTSAVYEAPTAVVPTTSFKVISSDKAIATTASTFATSKLVDLVKGSVAANTTTANLSDSDYIFKEGDTITLSFTAADGATKSNTVTVDSSTTLGDLFKVDNTSKLSGNGVKVMWGAATAITDSGGNQVELATNGTASTDTNRFYSVNSSGAVTAVASANSKTTANVFTIIGDKGVAIDNVSLSVTSQDGTTSSSEFLSAIGLSSTAGFASKAKVYVDPDAQQTSSASTDLTFYIGGEANFGMDISINKMTTETLLGVDAATFAGYFTSKETLTSNNVIDKIDTALATAMTEQTKLGAYESRLGYASDNLTTMNENLEAADSAMRDSDIAKEMTTYMKYAVLSQASQYMLAQAGQNAFQVLNLLQQ